MHLPLADGLVAAACVEGTISGHGARLPMGRDLLRQAGAHDLKIATIFNYGSNPDNADAGGILPDLPDRAVRQDVPKRGKLVEFINLYNQTYSTNESVTDGKRFYTYYRALVKRVKGCDRNPPSPG